MKACFPDCEEEHDFEAGIQGYVSQLGLPVKHSRMVGVQSKASGWLMECAQKQEAGERVGLGLVVGRDAVNLCLLLVCYYTTLHHSLRHITNATGVVVSACIASISYYKPYICHSVTNHSAAINWYSLYLSLMFGHVTPT